METGDLGVVEVKMKQIIEEQDAIKMDKDEEKARQLRLSNLETSVISGSVTSVLKPSKKSKVMSSNGKIPFLRIFFKNLKRRKDFGRRHRVPHVLVLHS